MVSFGTFLRDGNRAHHAVGFGHGSANLRERARRKEKGNERMLAVGGKTEKKKGRVESDPGRTSSRVDFDLPSQRPASLVPIYRRSMGSSTSKVAKGASRSFPKTPSASSSAGVSFPPPPISFPSPSSRPTPSPSSTSSNSSSPSQPPPADEPGSSSSSTQHGASETKTDGKFERDEICRRPTH